MNAEELQAKLDASTNFADSMLASIPGASEKLRANVRWHTSAIQASLLKEYERMKEAKQTS